jgi:hypothetical protein
MIKIGTLVEVIRSPYLSVPIGAIGRVVAIKYFAKRYYRFMYVLDNLPCHHFWPNEIKLIGE